MAKSLSLMRKQYSAFNGQYQLRDYCRHGPLEQRGCSLRAGCLSELACELWHAIQEEVKRIKEELCLLCQCLPLKKWAVAVVVEQWLDCQQGLS